VNKPADSVLPEFVPTLDAVRDTASRIAPFINHTPQLDYYGGELPGILPDIDLSLKQELFQRTGSFKPRGAINVVLGLDASAKEAGITAFSAGNHAIATAYAAHCLGVDAKVVMPATANPYRVEACKRYGAKVLFAENIAEVLSVVERLQKEENRSLVHPFEGEGTTLGTATLGLEMCEHDASLQAVVVPVGGGGLISGVAAAVKRMLPACRVYGVEPLGANGMQQSLKLGYPVEHVDVSTIADSLGAPLHTPYAYSLVSACVDDVVCVSDDELKQMMRMMFEDLKLAVEPAAAAALAAIRGPLRKDLAGLRVGVVVCGSNVGCDTWFDLVGIKA